MDIFRILIFLGAFSPLVLHATLPAEPADVLCGATHVIEGKVIDARLKDCRLELEGERQEIPIFCAPKDMASLQVKVSRILGVKDVVATYPRNVGIDVGSIVEVNTALHNSKHFPSDGIYGRIGINPPTEDPISKDRIVDLFVGKKFIFSIHVLYGDVLQFNGREQELIRNNLNTQPYYSGVWRLEQLKWVEETLTKDHGKTCPRPLH
jgi:hypothetical protein